MLRKLIQSKKKREISGNSVDKDFSSKFKLPINRNQQQDSISEASESQCTPSSSKRPMQSRNNIVLSKRVHQKNTPTVSNSEENQSPPSKKLCESLNIKYLAVILPLFQDQKGRPLQQTILVHIDPVELDDIGLREGLDFYMDNELNLFSTKVEMTTFSFRFIAIGESKSALKDSLIKNTDRNSDWKRLKPFYHFTDKVLKVTHDSSALRNKPLPYIRMSEENLKKLFFPRTEIQELDESMRQNSSLDENITHSDIEANDSFESKQEKSISCEKIIDESSIDKSERFSQKKLLKQINEKISDISRRKVILSEFDSSAVIIRLLIDVVNDISLFLSEKSKDGITKNHEVPEKDKTFKNEAKNEIFIEGKLQLSLDLYEKAVKLSKSGDANNTAYELAKIAFPKSYTERTTLGKRFYTEDELRQFINQINSCEKSEKIPLVFVFGFNDPFHAPYIGEFNPKLGRERIEALFNHIFRVSGFKSYSEKDLSAVRSRIVRVLTSKNGRNSKRIRDEDKEKDDGNDNDDDNSYFIFSEDENSQNILDSEIFK